MSPKISIYLQTRFGSTQKGLDFFQFIGWLIAFGITLPLFSYILISPVIFLTLILLFALGIVWIIILWKKGTAILSTPIDAGMVAIFLAPLITLYFALDPSRGVRTIWQWAALILLFYLVLGLFRSGFSFYPFVKALLLVSLIFVLFGYFELISSLIEWYGKRGWPLSFPSSITRVSGLLGNPNVLGNFLGMIFAMGTVVFIEFKRHRSIWLGGWLGATAVILIATQSRGAWVGLFVAFIAYGLSKAWRKSRTLAFSRKQWGMILLGIMGATAVLIALLFLLRPTTFSTNAPLSGRSGLWRVALSSWWQSPWVGGGMNSYPSLELQMTPVPYGPVVLMRTAHNFYLNTLAEMGLIGLTAVFFLMAQIGWLLWRQQEQWSSWTAVFFTPLVALITQAQVDVPLLRIIVMAALFLAALIASITPYDPTATPSRRRYLPYFWLIVWLLLLVSGWTGWQRVKLYEEGVSYTKDSNWEAANNTFYTGQSLTPYVDSLFSSTTGFSDGVLAYTNEAYLDAAIENQEQWVNHEPGWSVHHANLAGLYRQAGRNEEAIAEMEQAIAHAPEVPLYYLNLGLWYEEDGDMETAVSFYRQLYQLSHTWHDSSFWKTPTIAHAISDLPPVESALYEKVEEKQAAGDEDGAEQILQNMAGYDALINGRFDEALIIFNDASALFEQLLAQNKPSIDYGQGSNAYLGLGITHLYAGNIASAEAAFEQAATWSSSNKLATATVALWQVTLPTAAKDALPIAATDLQHYYGVIETYPFSRYYTIALFQREPIPHDFLPQLSCFTFAPNTGMHMQLLQEWYTSTGDTENADYLNTLLLGAGDGLDPCTPIDMKGSGNDG